MTKDYEVVVTADTINAYWQQFRPYVQKQLTAYRNNWHIAEQLPATGKLIKAYILRLEKWIELADSTPDLSEMATTWAELVELRSWVSPVLSDTDPDAALDQFGDILCKAGFTYTQSRTLIENRTVPKGAPPAKHNVYLTAADWKLMHNLSYAAIAAKLCKEPAHGSPRHNESCRENFRKGIKEVEKLLEKYDADLPDRN